VPLWGRSVAMITHWNIEPWGNFLVAVRVANLSKTFRKGQKALDDVNLTLGEGDMVALIGASGSGKSTLIRHIAGLVSGDKTSGRISVFDDPIQEKGRIAKGVRKTRRHIGVVFQQFNLVNRLSTSRSAVIRLNRAFSLSSSMNSWSLALPAPP